MEFHLHIQFNRAISYKHKHNQNSYDVQACTHIETIILFCYCSCRALVFTPQSSKLNKVNPLSISLQLKANLLGSY